MDLQKRKDLMRSALLIALADKSVTAEEKEALRSVQKELALDDDMVRELVAEVRKNQEPGERLRMTSEEAVGALESMIGVCAADGNVTVEEIRLLERIAARFGITGTEWQAVLERGMTFVQTTGADREDDPEFQRRRAEAENLVEQLYVHFHDWPDARQRAQRFVELGRAALTPLLRAFESYRVPDHCPDAAAFKTLLVGCLAQMRDTRSVFYLGAYLDMGASTDNADERELQRAAAEAIGTLVHLGVPRTEQGVAQARDWWRTTGSRTYKTLAY
jgi:tellurite resistance protein